MRTLWCRIQPASQFGARPFTVKPEVKSAARGKSPSADLFTECEGFPRSRKVIERKRRALLHQSIGHDAVGVRLTELPLTPEAVLRGIQALDPTKRGW